MKISVNWLQDYVDLQGITAKQIADKLTQITCEVEEVVALGRGLDSVVVGKVLTCENHPQSDHLHILRVDVGQKQPLQIVCGAPNARAGLMVAVATIGTTMPDGLKIARAKLRGVDSCGMCCSYAELGYKDDNEGIIELPTTAKIGAKISTILPGLVDEIIDIDNKSITNRPDLWGHYGIARELSVIFDRPLKPIDTAIVHTYDALPKLNIKIESDKCLSYGAIKVQNVGNVVSPDIIQNRLYKLGHHSHGLLVDITNYVMFAFGNPIHAFDAAKVGKIAIGHIPAGEKFVTLKDNQITATPEMLFIKSNGQAVALAGVMGGKNSEITPDTKDTVFEVATFDAANVRRTSVAVGIRSDASMRYEKALDPETNWLAMAEILRLVKQYAPQAQVASAFTRVTSAAANKPAQTIVVSKQKLESVTGVSFAGLYDVVGKKLTALGFQPQITKDQITVTVPSFRRWKDITTPADVIEEIIRNYGYQNIQPVAPLVAIAPIAADRYAQAKDALKDSLALKFGFSEVHTNIWYDAKAVKNLGIAVQSYATVANPFNQDDDKIRSEMLTSMLSVALVNKLQPHVRVFEIGRVLNKDGVEEEHLAGVCLGWDYKAVSEMLTEIFANLGIDLNYKIKALTAATWHPVNNAQVCGGKKNVGQVGIIHPKILADAVGFELNLSAIDFNAVAECKAPVLSKFPKTELDFTFVWNDTYAALDAVFAGFKNKLVTKRRLSAVYGNKFTLTFTVSSTEKTLDKEEIGKIHKEIVDFAAKHSVHLS